MANLLIDLPVSTGESFRFRTQLSGVTYRFHFLYNTLDDSWYFNLYDANGETLLYGVRAVVEYPLVSRSADPRLPPGDLVLVDTSGKGLDPGAFELGGRVKLIYNDGIEAAADDA